MNKPCYKCKNIKRSGPYGLTMSCGLTLVTDTTGFSYYTGECCILNPNKDCKQFNPKLRYKAQFK